MAKAVAGLALSKSARDKLSETSGDRSIADKLAASLYHCMSASGRPKRFHFGSRGGDEAYAAALDQWSRAVSALEEYVITLPK